MIALIVIANAYAAAVVITAGHLWVLGYAHALRHALAAYSQPPPPTPVRIPRSGALTTNCSTAHSRATVAP